MNFSNCVFVTGIIFLPLNYLLSWRWNTKKCDPLNDQKKSQFFFYYIMN